MRHLSSPALNSTVNKKGENVTKFGSLSLLASACLLAACGGGSSPPAPLKGVFVDAPVAGLSYTGSSGVSGETDGEGRFSYAPGSTVTFSMGSVSFPPVQPSAMVTPLDLVGASAPDHPGALAIARLLQSVDSDGDPDNGIRVNKARLAGSAKAPADWSSIDSAQLGALLSDAKTLRPEAQARKHMADQLAQRSGDPKMTLVGRYASGGKDKEALVAEILSYHPASKSLFITVDTTSEPSSFKRIDLSGLPTTALANPTTASNLTPSARYHVADHVNDGNFTAGGVQSLDVSGNLLAIAVQAKIKTDPGVIAFYRLSATGEPSFLKKVSVGALPDGVAFSADGKFLVVANEGELSTTFATDGIDPEGSISLIPIKDSVPADTATTLDFRAFNTGGSRSKELPAEVRIGRPGASVAQDLEPEYVSISEDSRTAYVTLQENNAVAVVDLAGARISQILPLGYKDYGKKYKIAASDRYAGEAKASYDNPSAAPTLKNHPNLYGVYMPDGIASYTVGGKTYLLTANEGDDRDDFLAEAETARFSALVSQLDAAAFPIETVNRIKTDQELGRLTLLAKDAKGKFGDTDGDGDYDRLYVLGGRSFSVWDASTGAQVFDSGEDIERVVYNDAAHDAQNSAALLKAAQMLGRLDNKGPEPESVVVGQVGAHTYAFIGVERSSGILMYRITDPAKPKFVRYVRNTTNLADGDISPEGMKFIPASQSPTGQALLVVGHEVSGSVAVYQIQ